MPEQKKVKQTKVIMTKPKDDKYKELSTKIILLEHKLEEMYKIVKRLQIRAGLWVTKLIKIGIINYKVDTYIYGK